MRRLTARYGHRGLWLVLLGSIWMVFGVGLFLSPERRVPGAIHQAVPFQVQAAAWMLTAAAAIMVGLRGRGRDDSLGHLALWIMPAVRMLSYAGSWVLYLVTTGLVHVGLDVQILGYDRGWYPALVWVFVVTMLRLVAAWPNPSALVAPPVEVHR